MYLYTNAIFSSSGAVIPFSNDYSFEYDGSLDYINADSSSSSVSSDNEGTISLWVKPDDITSSQTIVCLSASTLASQYLYLGLNSSYGFFVGMRTTSSSSSGFFVHADVNPFSVGTWTHLAIVQDGVSPQLYVNGVAVAQTFLVSTNDQKWLNDMLSFNSINIGRFFTSIYNQNYFDGKVDEFSYFSSALSSTDISNIYGLGVPTSISSLNPVIHLRAEGSTFNGSNWDVSNEGSGGNNATSVSMNLASRSTDVPT